MGVAYGEEGGLRISIEFRKSKQQQTTTTTTTRFKLG
jgi:hypothetical protein